MENYPLLFAGDLQRCPTILDIFSNFDFRFSHHRFYVDTQFFPPRSMHVEVLGDKR
jgi:hypothetical protein